LSRGFGVTQRNLVLREMERVNCEDDGGTPLAVP
jgi:hypothetical protein